MKISIERSPQHWCPNEGSNSELFGHSNDTVAARPQLHNFISGHVHETLKVLSYCQSDKFTKLPKQTPITTTTQTYFV